MNLPLLGKRSARKAPARTLVIGGARSGKSAEAERLLATTPEVCFVATAYPADHDDEWTERVRRHRDRRPPHWRTVETLDLVGLLATEGEALLIDCLTLWLTRVMDRHDAWDEEAWAATGEKAVLDEVEALAEAWRATPRRVVAVTNEVGPGRRSRDSGRAPVPRHDGRGQCADRRRDAGRQVVRGRTGGRAVRDALRLSFGTLTILPVRPPAVVDRRTASRAMVLAPVVGLLLGLVVAVLLLLLPSTVSPLLASALVVGTLALLTRGMHLDGLADTADGLGSRTPAEQALALMRQGDIGPFGVVTVVLTLLLQTAAMAQLVTDAVRARRAGRRTRAQSAGAAAPVHGAGTGGPGGRPGQHRRRLGRALRRDRRGHARGSRRACFRSPSRMLVPGIVPMTTPAAPSVFGGPPLHFLSLVLIPLLVTGLFARHCVRRLGGVTGDVLGACIEITFTAALVVAAL